MIAHLIYGVTYPCCEYLTKVQIVAEMQNNKILDIEDLEILFDTEDVNTQTINN